MAIPIERLLKPIRKLIQPSSEKSLKSQILRRVGLNIGRSALVACEVVVDENEIVLERCARLPINRDYAISGQLKDWYQQVGFESKHVSVSLKGQGVVVRYLSF